MGPHENQFLLVRSQFAISGRLQIVVTVFLYVSTVSQFKGSDFNRLTGVGFYGNNKMLKSLSLLSLAVAGAVYSTAAFAEEEKIRCNTLYCRVYTNLEIVERIDRHGTYRTKTDK